MRKLNYIIYHMSKRTFYIYVKYNKTKEERHLELTKYLYNKMKSTYRDAVDRFQHFLNH